jgi:cytidylate kinase
MHPPTITIDGPAAAGKSTVARRVAQALGLRFLDTGAMYRAVAWMAARLGLSDPDDIPTMARYLRLEMEDTRVRVDGRDVTQAIRTPEITALVRPIANSPGCRGELVRMQRELGRNGGIVTEGRDQGSVVFPGAEYKFYLDASIDVRARRRQAQEGGALEDVRRALEARDREDRERAVGPLVEPAGAVRIDTSALTVEEVVAKILAAVGSR